MTTEQRKSRVRWFGVAAAAAAIVLLVVFGSRLGIEIGANVSPLIGRPVPDSSLTGLESSDVIRLSEMEAEVTVVNFWASWCAGCITEHPSLLATSDAYADRNVQFVGVVYQDRIESAIDFLDELGRGDRYIYVTDNESRVAIDFGVRGLPETFFVDGSGNIVAKISGPANALVLASTIDQILNGATPGERTVGTIQTNPGG